MKANPNHPTRGVMNMQRMRRIQSWLKVRRVITADIFDHEYARKSKEVKNESVEPVQPKEEDDGYETEILPENHGF